jgi:hypothetical protein
MDSTICFEAPLSSLLGVSPRLAESAAPAAFCWALDLAGISISFLLEQNGRRRQSFLSSSGLWAARFSDVSLSTIYCGSVFDAFTLWPLMFVGLLCFLTALPSVFPGWYSS